MAEPATAGAAAVVLTGLAVLSAFGRGRAALEPALAGTPAFGPVTRFGTERRRTDVAATLPGTPVLADELVAAIRAARVDAGLPERGGARGPGWSGGGPGWSGGSGGGAPTAPDPLLLAAHADRTNAAMAADVVRRTGLRGPARTYTAAWVAASTAVADAAAMIVTGRADRVVVAAGHLVDEDMFALFDAGRVLARDGRVRPFSTGRQGILLADAVAAVVLESTVEAERRGVPAQAGLVGWGRAGDAYHVCQPRPDGAGLARAIEAALRRGGVAPDEIGYVNANGTGTPYSDISEACALHRALGDAAGRVPVSSTKSVHGHALEASGLLELVVTVLALRTGRLPVNAGFLGPDPDCPLDVVLPGRPPTRPAYALSLNAAFGGANTALLVGAGSS
jgi:3-oxoacyl-(acyl-carrier-protein) synthase